MHMCGVVWGVFFSLPDKSPCKVWQVWHVKQKTLTPWAPDLTFFRGFTLVHVWITESVFGPWTRSDFGVCTFLENIGQKNQYSNESYNSLWDSWSICEKELLTSFTRKWKKIHFYCSKFILCVMVPRHCKLGQNWQRQFRRKMYTMLWPFGLREICKGLGFKSNKSLEYAHKAIDHHKSWALLNIFYQSSMFLLLEPYIIECNEKGIMPTSAGYHHFS